MPIEGQLEFRKKMVSKILMRQHVRVSSSALSSAKLKSICFFHEVTNKPLNPAILLYDHAKSVRLVCYRNTVICCPAPSGAEPFIFLGSPYPNRFLST